MPFEDLDEFRIALGAGAEPRDGEAQPEQLPLVFVVDDDANIRASLELLLQRKYRIKTFPNATDGVGALTDDVTAVVLDVKMTGVDGFAAYKQMRERDPDLPIIFYSAYQDIKDPYEILNEYRPFGYITKGEDHEALLRSLGAAVEQRRRTTKYRIMIDELDTIRVRMEALRKRLVGG